MNTRRFCGFGIWVILVASLFACENPQREPEILAPEIISAYPANVTNKSATIVAWVIPNGSASVSIRCKAISAFEWTVLLDSVCTGDKFVEIKAYADNLTRNTEYQFLVSVVNEADSVEWGNTFVTYLGVNKPMVIIYPATDITMTTASISATLVPDDSTTFVFKYAPKGSNTWTTVCQKTFVGSDSAKIKHDFTDLTPGVKYMIYGEATNAAGTVKSPLDSIFMYAVADYDGNLYHTVTIGSWRIDPPGEYTVVPRTWLRENFRGTHYANGDPIQNVTDAEEWANLTTGAYCWYNNDSEIGKVYGGLYNWWVGADKRGLIPGYKTPTGPEFVALGNYVANGVTCDAGPMLMEAGTVHWKTPAKMGTNSSGFTGLPNGARGYVNGSFMNLMENMGLWENDIEDLHSTSAALAEIDYRYCWFDPGILYKKNLGVGIRLLKME